MRRRPDSKINPPYGQFCFPLIWEQDKSCSNVVKSIMVILTILSLVLLWNIPNYIDSDWDKNHEMVKSDGLLLLKKTLGMSSSQISIILGATAVLGLLFMLIDWILVDVDVWPKQRWDMDNTLCYDEMFTEPLRRGRVIRRPGNALSNLSYFMTSLFILSTSAKPICDALFGIIVMVLFISSFLWHATHAPWVHYVDLWSMDLSIAYLILRSVCQFLCGSSSYFDFICTLLYGSLAVHLGRHYYIFGTRDEGLHGSCPISVRARLSGKSNVLGKGHIDLLVKDACLFCSLPVLYCVIPYLLLTPYYEFSLTAAKWTCRTLIIGWSYRCFERWTLDGCLIMNWAKDRSVLASAILSPTSVLHFLTGFTMLFGFMILYSLDEKE